MKRPLLVNVGLLCCGLLQQEIVQAISPLRAVDILKRRRQQRHLRQTHRDDDGDVEERYLTQPLDHFAKSPAESANGVSFQQRYFYSQRYASSDTRLTPKTKNAAPVYAFLCVGGEGPSLSKRVLVDSVHCSGDMIELARILHKEQDAAVYLFALEHRYYGNSYPVFTDDKGNPEPPVTTKNLVHLSSRQALADLANFVEAMNQKWFIRSSGQNTDDNLVKWVTFGGSYPGMLAAWARLEYPGLIHAAVSNSAPVQARVDFGAYNDRVAFDLQYERVGGSLECLNIVLEGHNEIVQKLQLAQYADVENLFHVCRNSSLAVKENAWLFVGDGVIEVPAQSNDPNCMDPLCNIKKLCSSMTAQRNSSLTAMEILANISRTQNSGIDCVEANWNASLAYLASPKAQEGGLRSWLWQTCTEFGFYQTCEQDSFCPFARGYHPLDMDMIICQRAFGIDPCSVRSNVERSLDYYGGKNMSATRILSVNGDVDPWSMLARTIDYNVKALPAIIVPGASHHWWTHNVTPNDDSEIVDARIMIYLKVIQWLQEAPDAVQ